MLEPNLFLIKPSPEIFLKSERVKLYFNKKLRENIKCALSRNNIEFSELEQGRGRMFLQCKEIAKAREVLGRIFGIHAIAPVFAFSAPDLLAIKSAAVEYCQGRIKEGTFAVKAVRSGEQSFSSQEIERAVGAAVLQAFPKLKVNLSKPEQKISIEIYEEQGLCYVDETPCFGGLPQGVEGSVAMFFSGKKEEAAAAWLLMKRGCNVFPVGKDAASVRKILAFLEPWNAYRKFILTEPKNLEKLIPEREILMLASAETGVSKKDFANYEKSDKKQPLPVLRPLLFLPKEKMKELLETIKGR
ncbi:MAG: THUMP domain-containing protein [Candidatus Diapherotrites archaeon]|nr:THUMP domain-containing protein [Candidatus Diapherotrites archaeon]